jgi:hypothetical protein
LAGKVGVGNRLLSAHAAAGAARELPRSFRGPPHDRSDLFERHGENVMQDERDPFCGSERLEDDEQREANRVTADRILCSGSTSSSSAPGSGNCTPAGSSRRLRDRRMSRHTRPTTVVNHPLRFSTPLVRVRLSRNQASWTASSASLSDPSMRYATALRRARSSSNRSANQSCSSIVASPRAAPVMVMTNEIRPV